MASFTAPTDYSAELADIERRRAYAQALQQQGMSPLETNQTAGGYVVPVSPMAGLAKMLQAYSGRKGMEAATEQQKALASRLSGDTQNTLQQARNAFTGAPASSETIVDELANGGEGMEAQINAPARAANPGAGFDILAGSQNPMLAQMGMTGMMEQFKPKKPVVVGRSLMKEDGTVVGTDSTWAQEQAAERSRKEAEAVAKREEAQRREQSDQAFRAQLERDRAADRENMLRVAAGLRPAPAPLPLESVLGPDGKPVLVSRADALGKTPASSKDGARALPTTALKMQQEELDAISTASTINADLGGIAKQITDGKLQLGPVNNLLAKGRNLTGFSDENSRNLATFNATLERLRNESLRLNKGVQTDGDAQRAWNELVTNINDPKVVSQRLAEIQKINERAVNIRKMNIDAIRNNFNAGPLETSGFANQPSALGGQSAPSAVQEGATATGPGGKKIVFRNGQWVPM